MSVSKYMDLTVNLYNGEKGTDKKRSIMLVSFQLLAVDQSICFESLPSDLPKPYRHLTSTETHFSEEEGLKTGLRLRQTRTLEGLRR